MAPTPIRHAKNLEMGASVWLKRDFEIISGGQNPCAQFMAKSTSRCDIKVDALKVKARFARRSRAPRFYQRKFSAPLITPKLSLLAKCVVIRDDHILCSNTVFTVEDHVRVIFALYVQKPWVIVAPEGFCKLRLINIGLVSVSIWVNVERRYQRNVECSYLVKITTHVGC
jgi:hypothetical protein